MISEQDIGMVSRFCKDRDIIKLLSSEETVWKGINRMQDTLDQFNCSQYLNALADICNGQPSNATPEDRVKAFLFIKLKR